MLGCTGVAPSHGVSRERVVKFSPEFPDKGNMLPVIAVSANASNHPPRNQRLWGYGVPNPDQDHNPNALEQSRHFDELHATKSNGFPLDELLQILAILGT
jgi:hypothetical protein